MQIISHWEIDKEMKIGLLVTIVVFLVQIPWIYGWSDSPENIEQQAFRVIGAVISAGYSLGVAVLLLFPILYLILKRKNIPKRPYFILAIAGSLTYFGIASLISFLQSWVTASPVIDPSQPYILDQLVISLMIPIIELSIGGTLLCRSSVIRKLIKK